MSGPLRPDDPESPHAAVGSAPGVEILEGRRAQVGRIDVLRLLPRRGRRTIGAWCFADVLGPADVTERSGLDIGPHPHTGLQTVTWLVEGEVLHRDSLGSEQVVAPGQLNLMTAGGGVAHSEEATGRYAGSLRGIQLWVGQPERTRHGEAAFEHHADLPRVELPGVVATVLVGALAEAVSPARCDTPLVGAELLLTGGTSQLPLDRRFEHGLVVLTGSLSVAGLSVRPGQLAYLEPGQDHVPVGAEPGTRVLLLGGEPFDEPLVMWWNFVARSRGELELAREDWEKAGTRFGEVASPLDRIPAPPVPWR